ncbi:MAG: Mur ligase family protein [Bacteroidota bacterium]
MVLDGIYFRPYGPGCHGSRLDWSQPVAGVTVDSRLVEPGWLFLAVRGSQFDGNRFIPAALTRGAVAVLTDNEAAVPRTETVETAVAEGRVLVVSDVRWAVARAAANFYGHPGREMNVAGVTGTLGKTSVSHILYSILREDPYPRPPGIIGSLGIHYGDIHLPSRLTTPDAVTLQRTLAEMREAGVRVAVMEVSSHGQLQRRVDEIPFRLGVFLNLVAGEHADVHPDFSSYVQVKSRFLSELSPDAVLVFNHDDPGVRELVVGAHEEWRPLGYSMGLTEAGTVPAAPAAAGTAAAPATAAAAGTVVVPGSGTGAVTEMGDAAGYPLLRVTGLRLSLDGSRFTVASASPLPVVGGEERQPVHLECRLSLLGAHNVANALAAIAGALALGVPETVIGSVLPYLKPFRRRMELIYRGDFSVLDDTTGHPRSFEALFTTVELLRPRRLILLTAPRGNRGLDINRANAATIAARAGRLPLAALLVTAAWDRADAANRATEEEVAVFREELGRSGVPHIFHSELETALQAALKEVQPGDLLVVAGTQALDTAAEMLREAMGAPVLGPSRS